MSAALFSPLRISYTFRNAALHAYTDYQEIVPCERTLAAVHRSRPPLGVLCLVMGIGLLVIGLWPFNFFPRNQVRWLSDRNGVHFNGYGEIFSAAPLFSDAERTAADSAVSIELWLKPESQPYSFHTILSTREPKLFAVAQSGFDLVLEGLFLDQDNLPTFRRVFLDDVLRGTSARFLTVTSGLKGTTIYLEAVPAKTYSNLHLAGDDFRGELVLGQSPSRVQPWTGDLFGFALYTKVLLPEEVVTHYDSWLHGKAGQLGGSQAIYLFDERKGEIVHNRAASAAPDLLIPLRFEQLHLAILEFPHPFKKSDAEDTIVNILGFVPFGFLLTLYLHDVKHFSKRKALLLSVISGTMTSLFIEVAQVLLPTRDSSALDLINNIVGTMAGSELAIVMRDRCYRFLGLSIALAGETRESK